MTNLLITDLEGKCLGFPGQVELENSNDFYGHALFGLSRSYLVKIGEKQFKKTAIQVLLDYVKASKIDLEEPQYKLLNGAINEYLKIYKENENATIFVPNEYEVEGISKSGMTLESFIPEEIFNNYIEDFNKFYKLYINLKEQLLIIQTEVQQIEELYHVEIPGYSDYGNSFRLAAICENLINDMSMQSSMRNWHERLTKIEGKFAGIQVHEFPYLLESNLKQMLDVSEWEKHENVYVIGEYIPASESVAYLSRAKDVETNYNNEFQSSLESSKVIGVLYDEDFARKTLLNMTGNFNGELCLLHYNQGKLKTIFSDYDGDKLSDRLVGINVLIEKLHLEKGLQINLNENLNDINPSKQNKV